MTTTTKTLWPIKPSMPKI